MNRHSILPVAVVFALLAPIARAWDLDDWPTHHTFEDGTDVGLTGVYRYDVDEFAGDRKPDGHRAFEDSHTNRRKELGITLKKKGVYDAIVDYEFQGKTWLDTNVRVQSKALFGTDYGEIKRMYVRPEFRGRELGKLMLDHLADFAAQHGVSVLRLETGIHQQAAIRLYEGYGFMRIAPFGEYREDPVSLCFEKRI